MSQAHALYEEALRIERDAGDRKGVVLSLKRFGGLAVKEQQFERAARLLGAASALVELIGATLAPVDQAGIDNAISTLRTELGEAAYAQAWHAGRALSLDEAITYALETT